MRKSGVGKHPETLVISASTWCYRLTKTMEKRLLNLLRCPVTHKGLSLARREMLGRVNSAIQAGKVTNRGGELLAEPLSEALVTDDDKLLYPIANGIPVLLEGESVSLEQLE